MRVIIAGSRHCKDFHLVESAIRESGFEITEIVSGGAKGVDRIGEQIGARLGIPVHVFPPDWSNFGKAAGPVRNKRMAKNADALVAILFPGSRGTASMIAIAQKMGLQVFIKEMK